MCDRAIELEDSCCRTINDHFQPVTIAIIQKFWIIDSDCHGVIIGGLSFGSGIVGGVERG